MKHDNKSKRTNHGNNGWLTKAWHSYRQRVPIQWRGIVLVPLLLLGLANCAGGGKTEVVREVVHVTQQPAGGGGTPIVLAQDPVTNDPDETTSQSMVIIKLTKNNINQLYELGMNEDTEKTFNNEAFEYFNNKLSGKETEGFNKQNITEVDFDELPENPVISGFLICDDGDGSADCTSQKHVSKEYVNNQCKMENSYAIYYKKPADAALQTIIDEAVPNDRCDQFCNEDCMANLFAWSQREEMCL